jgi:hypothetical protein
MKAIIILAILLPMHIQAQVISQWRGEQRSGIYQESNLLNEWPEEGPPELWSTDLIGTGWGSASVSDEAIYITGTKDTLEYCSKIDLRGELIWQVTMGPGWMGSYNDAKTTPTVIGNKVYVISTRGRISCLDASSIPFRSDILIGELDSVYQLLVTPKGLVDPFRKADLAAQTDWKQESKNHQEKQIYQSGSRSHLYKAKEPKITTFL